MLAGVLSLLWQHSKFSADLAESVAMSTLHDLSPAYLSMSVNLSNLNVDPARPLASRLAGSNWQMAEKAPPG